MFIRVIIPAVGIGLILTTLTTTLFAQGRPDIRRMSCQRAIDLVDRHGAIVMTTGRHTYERIVANRSYCEHDEDVLRVRAPARDTPRCFVGYKCVPGFFLHDN